MERRVGNGPRLGRRYRGGEGEHGGENYPTWRDVRQSAGEANSFQKNPINWTIWGTQEIVGRTKGVPPRNEKKKKKKENVLKGDTPHKRQVVKKTAAKPTKRKVKKKKDKTITRRMRVEPATPLMKGWWGMGRCGARHELR